MLIPNRNLLDIQLNSNKYVFLTETQLLRNLPSVYKDGSYEPSGETRPNPIELSDALMNGTTGLGSHRNRTALLVFFGE